MAVFTPKDACVLFDGGEGRQLLDWLTNNGYGEREKDGLGYRYNFGSLQIGDVAAAWEYIKTRRIEKPVKPDKILEQLAVARLKPEKLRLFSPWGPRYRKTSPKIESSDPEMAVLRELKDALEEFQLRGFSPDFLLMPADAYGTEINGLSRIFVSDYFRYLEDAASGVLGESCSLDFSPWSAIREDKKARYDELRKELDQDFDLWVNESEYRNAVKTTGFFSPKKAESSARRYCIERLAEASIVSGAYDPIKLSLVRKEKDALDGPLKRVYIIRNRAPWLGE